MGPGPEGTLHAPADIMTPMPERRYAAFLSYAHRYQEWVAASCRRGWSRPIS